MNTKNQVLVFAIAMSALVVPVFAVVEEPIKLDFDSKGPLAMLAKTAEIQENFGPFNKANYLSSLYDSRGVYYSPETAGKLVYPLYIKRDAKPYWQGSQAILDAENSQPTFVPATMKSVKIVPVVSPASAKAVGVEKITPELQHAQLSVVIGDKQFIPGQMTLIMNLDNIASLHQGEKGATVTGLNPGKFRLVTRVGSTKTEYTISVVVPERVAGKTDAEIVREDLITLATCLGFLLIGLAVGWWYRNKQLWDYEADLFAQEKNMSRREAEVSRAEAVAQFHCNRAAILEGENLLLRRDLKLLQTSISKHARRPTEPTARLVAVPPARIESSTGTRPGNVVQMPGRKGSETFLISSGIKPG